MKSKENETLTLFMTNDINITLGYYAPISSFGMNTKMAEPVSIKLLTGQKITVQKKYDNLVPNKPIEIYNTTVRGRGYYDLKIEDKIYPAPLALIGYLILNGSLIRNEKFNTVRNFQVIKPFKVAARMWWTYCGWNGYTDNYDLITLNTNDIIEYSGKDFMVFRDVMCKFDKSQFISGIEDYKNNDEYFGVVSFGIMVMSGLIKEV